MTSTPPKALEYIRALRDDRTLTTTEKLAAVFMASHAGHDGANAHPGHKLLGEETSTSERTSKRTLASLVEKGWLTQTSSGRGNNRYASTYALSFPQSAMGGTLDEPTGQTEQAKVPNETSQGAISDSQGATGGPTNQPEKSSLEIPVNQVSDLSDREEKNDNQRLTDGQEEKPSVDGEAVEWFPGMDTRGTGYEYSLSLVEEINDWLDAERAFEGKGHLDARYLKKDSADKLLALMKLHGFSGIDLVAGLFYDTDGVKDGGEGIRRFASKPHNSDRLDKVGPVIQRELSDPRCALETMVRGRDMLAYSEPFFAASQHRAA